MPLSLAAAEDDSGRRLDRILRKALPEMPLSAIHRLLRKGDVLVDGEKAAIDCRVRAGQTITIMGIGTRDQGSGNSDSCLQSKRVRQELRSLKSLSSPPSLVPSPYPQSLFTDIILFEGAGLLVLNKPAGLMVHGRGSLEDLVRSYLEPKLPPSLSFRPGPLHRLDRPTSGVIAFSTNLEGARLFSAMMRNRMVKKQYLALVKGVIEEAEIWEDELIRDKRQKKTFSGPSKNGETKTALTTVRPLLGDRACTLVLAEIETGRTHQIRSQAAGRGHPLLGDKKYNASDIGGEFLLHAWRMEFTEKTDNDLYGELPRRIEAPLPKNFLDKIRNIFDKGIINNLLSQL